MSYSFSVQAATKDEAKAKVEAEFDKTIEYQPVHARDKAAVLANATAAIDLLGDDDTKDVYVSCNGYLSWQGLDTDTQITGASVSCCASFTSRAEQAQT